MNDVHDQEWHDRRRRTLGASEVAAVVGISRWSNACDVYDRKVYDLKSKPTMSTNLGHMLQPVIGKLAEEALDVKITAEEIAYVHQEKDWASSTVDYVARDEYGHPVLIECKATRDAYWYDIPDYYRTQLAWQCWTSGIRKSHIAVLHASTTFKTYSFDLDQDGGNWFESLVSACDRFWHENVLKRVRPDNTVDQSMLDAIRAVRGKTVEIDSMRHEYNKLCIIRAKQKELEELEKATKATIQAALGDSEIGLIDGKVVCTWKESESSRFDTTAFKADNPDLYSNYTKSSVSRRFLVKD